MLHEEFLGRVGEYRSGKLRGRTRQAMKVHLHSCQDCLRVVQDWDMKAPVPHLRLQVMTVLTGREVSRPLWAMLGSAAALMFALAAFWQPEQAWVRADRSFASAEVLHAWESGGVR